jgi:hypothetical protein
MPTEGMLRFYIDAEKVGEAKIKTQPGKFSLAGEGLKTATHPTLGLAYTKAGYQPMRELLAFLEVRDFTAYICSGGGRDFIGPVSEQMYGIPVSE